VAKESSIEWTKSTWNPWIGCTEVSPACDNCYAKEWDRRFHAGRHWGPGAPRLLTSIASHVKVGRWNYLALETEFAGIKGFWPVFVESLGDFFDNEVPPHWRNEAWTVMRECRNLTFIIVTKRVGNVAPMLPDDWGRGWPHVWLLVTACNQAEADRDIPKLLQVPAAMRGVSIEPMLGPVDLSRFVYDREDKIRAAMNSPAAFNRDQAEDGIPHPLDWVIVGGESGQNARPMHPEWVRSLRDQCQAAGVPFFFKQWGEFYPADQVSSSDQLKAKGDIGTAIRTGSAVDLGDQWTWRIGKKAAGRLLDGREWLELPQQPKPEKNDVSNSL
jgi:protein gp37